MPEPVIRFSIQFAQYSQVGRVEIDLLEAIQSAGTLSQAARDLRISYRHAWLIVDSLNHAFQLPVTVAKRGGSGGGGACLTGLGESLVVSYRALEREFAQLAARRLQSISLMAGERSSTLLGVPVEVG
jgi:molybdate transport system regulatory protein